MKWSRRRQYYPDKAPADEEVEFTFGDTADGGTIMSDPTPQAPQTPLAQNRSLKEKLSAAKFAGTGRGFPPKEKAGIAGDDPGGTQKESARHSGW